MALGVMTQDVIYPPSVKKRAVRALLFALGTVSLAAATLWFKPWLHHFLIDAPEAEAIDSIRLVFVGLAATVAGASAWGFWLAIQIFRHGQWTLPGTLVFRETPVTCGRWVRARLVVVLLWSILALGLAVYALVFPSILFGK